MTTIVREFFHRDPLTGDAVYPPNKSTTLSSTATLTTDNRTKIVAITTDSSTVTFAFGRDAVAADLAPAARGYFQMVTSGAVNLNFANA